MPLNSLINYSSPPVGGTYADSVYYNGKYYSITGSFYSDTYPLDQMDYFQASVSVEGLGYIYLMDENSRGCHEHFTMLLTVSDPIKEKVLELAYLKLSKADSWFDWKRCAELVQLYDFKTCEKRLSELWMKNRNDLELIESTIVHEGSKVNFSAKIVNRSKEAYFFGEGTHFGPMTSAETKKGVCVIDSLKSTWSYSMMQLKENTSLNPGDSVVISGQFFSKNDQIIYDGLQFYSSQNLLDLLFPNSLSCPWFPEEKNKMHWRYGPVLKARK